jgi:transposase
LIRRKSPELRLFYTDDELRRGSRTSVRYQRLNAVVGNWGELCKPLESCFSAKRDGRPVDPVVYFKIFVVGYVENIVCDVDLAERLCDSLAVREFVGYGPGETTPDHSSISRVREAFGERGLLDKILGEVVARCAGAGLVEGESVAVDSVLLRANCATSSLRCQTTGKTLREHMNEQREANIKPTASNKRFRSKSDPDARLTAKPGAPMGMYHKATHVTDGKSQVVLSVGVSLADVGECEAAKTPIERAKQILDASGLGLGLVVGDAGYDDAEFHAWLEDLPATPLTNYQHASSPKPKGLAKQDFTYDAAADRYVCPQGKILSRSALEGPRVVYAAQEKDCLNCPLRGHCLKPRKRRRLLKTPLKHIARHRNIARCHTDEGRKALKKRKTIVEPPFAHMKRCGGLHKLNCRTSRRVNTKVGVAAIVWNLLKLAKNLSPEQLERLLRSFGTQIRLGQSPFTAPSLT